MRLFRTLVLLPACLGLTACAGVALTAFGVGAATGVQHTLTGITYRTFTVPEARVRSATLVALGRMGIQVTPQGRDKQADVIEARANDRSIEVDLESLSPNTTRMKAVARQGLFYDSATAYEIILQTERALSNPT